MVSGVKLISGAVARERFDRGEPVDMLPAGSQLSPIWQHRGYGWARTWDGFITSPRWWGPEQATVFVAPRKRKSLTQVYAAGAMLRYEEFACGNIDGTHHFIGGEATAGDLPEKYLADFAQAHYAVWSYDTPIGWLRQDGTLFMPPVRYSLTTTQHQGLLARAWDIWFMATESARKGKGKSPYGPRSGGH